MKSLDVRRFGFAAVIALLVAAPLAAQERTGGGTRESGSGGGGGGAAAARGSEGGGGSMSSGSSGGGAVSGGFSGSSGSSGFSGGGSTSTPTPFSSGASVRRSPGEASGRAMGRTMGRSGLAADPSDSAIPAGSRPNYGRPTTGHAVSRTGQWAGNEGGGGGTSNPRDYGYYYGGYYGSYGYNGYPWLYGASMNPWNSFGYYGIGSRQMYYYPYNPGYLYGYGTYGLGYFYFDPLWLDAASPFGMSYGAMMGDPYFSGLGGSGGGYGAIASGGYGGTSSRGESESLGAKGGVKFKVKPADAEVYVDGALVGTVGGFDGPFQRLELSVGPHRVEIRANGYQTLSFEIRVEPRDTVTYRGEMVQVR